MVALVTRPTKQHVVQLYESQAFLWRSAAAFFTEGLSESGPMVVASRPATFAGICAHLAPVFRCAPADVEHRVMFVDAWEALRDVMVDGMPDPIRFEQTFSTLLDNLRASAPGGTIRICGELADVLCADGRYAAAIRLEELWNAHFGGSGVSLLCAYDMSRFDEDSGGSCLRTICRAHTLVIPTEVYPEGLDERARFEHVALVQQRARQRAGPTGQAADPNVPVTTEVICLIEDDPSVRRSLGRLLSSVGLRVKAYQSAEAFLAGINEVPIGCIIADVQLTGMSGLELQARLQGTGWPMILVSGASDARVEAEALRRGARAFLRKPFQAPQLFDAIRRALS